MSERTRPESLEGRWDILYRDYPEVYEAFTRIPKRPDVLEVVIDRFGLGGKTVVDVGAGTGVSTFKLARHARRVIGVELEPAMLALARANARGQQVGAVDFVAGDAERLALASGSVDVALGVTLANQDVAAAAIEMERVVRPGGVALRVDVTPGWYGGHLQPIITGRPREPLRAEASQEAVLLGRGYAWFDVEMDQAYGSVEALVATYGFIHSKRVIDYARAHQVTSIRWKFRVRYKVMPPAQPFSARW